jgi:hypothetical protein
MDMTSTKWKLATALGFAGAIALSVPSAEARGGRNAAIGFGIAAGALALGAAAASASQPYYYNGYDGYYGGGPYAYSGAYSGGPYAYGDAYAYERPYVYDSYNSYNYVAPTPYYSRRRSGQSGPANYDRNAN